MRAFKTICHNNIHRDYTDELIKVDPSSHILWRDPRPTYKGELKIISTQSVRDLQFEILDLIVGQEYTIQIKDGHVSLVGVGEMVMFGSVNTNSTIDSDIETQFGHYMLFDTDRTDGLYYREFFYSEEDMREKKISDIIG